MITAMQTQLKETATRMFLEAGESFVSIVPYIVLVLVVLAVGIFVAHCVCRIVLYVLDFIGLDKLAAKVNVDRVLHSIGIQRSISKIVSLLVYWLIVLFALFLLSELLELSTVSDAIGVIVAYIPNLIAGLLILVVGLLVGRFFRDVVSTSLARAGISSGALIGYIVQAVIVIFVCLIALGQVGFDVSIITTNIAVILGVLLVSTGFAIAFAIRPVLENYFICRQLRGQLRKGDTIEFEDVKGEIVDISLTSIVLRQHHTDIIIPVRQLFERRFMRTRSK
jgi:hypothetical protein